MWRASLAAYSHSSADDLISSSAWLIGLPDSELQIREVIRIGSDRLGHAVEDSRSLDAWDPGPGPVVESLAGRRDSPIEILSTTRRIATDHDVVGRAHSLGGPPVSGVDPPAVDIIFW